MKETLQKIIDGIQADSELMEILKTTDENEFNIIIKKLMVKGKEDHIDTGKLLLYLTAFNHVRNSVYKA